MWLSLVNTIRIILLIYFSRKVADVEEVDSLGKYLSVFLINFG